MEGLIIKDPDPDPGGPKTYGFYGSGSGPLAIPFFEGLKSKEGGLYYMGGTYIFFLHPKWSKLCTAPLMGPKNPPTKKKF